MAGAHLQQGLRACLRQDGALLAMALCGALIPSRLPCPSLPTDTATPAGRRALPQGCCNVL